MAKANSRNRVVLQLDPRIALEAIILNRLERIPKARRQEWVRGLLVQGFRIECQVQREASVATRSESGMRFSEWLTGDSTRQAPLPKPKREQKPMAPTEVRTTPNATKPFAQLSRVIG
ncbi:MAG: hypothetical protein RNU03_13825 [Candidatus Sedimenticola sp. (ex Thyasira tokunagai)]